MGWNYSEYRVLGINLIVDINIENMPVWFDTPLVSAESVSKLANCSSLVELQSFSFFTQKETEDYAMNDFV